MDELRYPVGTYEPVMDPDKATLNAWISEIKLFPKHIIELTSELSNEELQWRYRPGGWNIKQLVHHCADSHLNSIIRFKLALTEDSPEIRPYYEDRWAELADANDDNIRPSLDLIRALHRKWVMMLKSLSEEQLGRQFVHPEYGKKYSLAETIGNYAWHCRHHLAHIKLALQDRGQH